MTWTHSATMTRVKALTPGTFLHSFPSPFVISNQHFFLSRLSNFFSSQKFFSFSSFFSLLRSRVSVVSIMLDEAPPPLTVVAGTSSVESELTGNEGCSMEFVEQEENSVMESQKIKSSDWTDEKHSLYLKSMEASFVDQLYNFSDMRSLQMQKDWSCDSDSPRKIHANTHTPFGQFKVLQDGCWSRINFRRENSQSKGVNRPNVSPGNPWIKHFSSGGKHGALPSPSPQENPSSTATSKQLSMIEPELCCQESGGCDIEVTDQNFVEEETVRHKATRLHVRKRMRSSADGHSGSDQVVPFRTFPVTEIADNYVSPKTET